MDDLVELVSVDYPDSELECPKCKETLSRIGPGCHDPSGPMPDAPENGKNVSHLLGQAYCERCGVMRSWVYRLAAC